jgi:mannose/cellobiose epimerase-like protein (N-acyl-D-glucosamine 2-epimerase family)
MQAIDEDGDLLEVDAEGTGAGDLFCAKGLVASGIPGKVETGKEMFEHYVETALALRYASEQTKDEAELVTHGSCMLALGAVTHLVERSEDDAERVKWAELTARLIDFVLDRHYDSETAVFSEFVTREGARKQPHLDPGHANELVGLGLEAIEAVRESGVALAADVASTFERAEDEFPRLLVKSFEVGYNAEHHGLFKAVDNRTAEPINDDLPWWNLPETMRAAVRAAAVSDDAPDEDRLLDIARVCSNDYFAYYINPENMLFPYQTRSGRTGEVIDVAPAIPEGDPLYHTNLALIDMKAVLKRIGR